MTFNNGRCARNHTYSDRTPPTCWVRVWFADQAICSYVSEPIRARAYADLMAQRFAGLRITIDEPPRDLTGVALPDSSALWPLTVK